MTIIVHPMGGLFNRMSAVACGYNLSKLSTRKLVVHHALPDANFDFEMEDFMKFYPFTFYPKTQDRWKTYEELRASCYVPYLFAAITETEQSDKRDELDKMLLEMDKPWYVISGGDVKPFNQSKADVNSTKAEFYSKFRWNDKSYEDAAPYIDGEYVGLHLRYTDRKHLMPDDARIHSLIESHERVFICSDDLEKLAIFMKHDNAFRVPYDSVDRVTPEGIHKAIVQWIVLSNSTMIYASLQSTFSLEARYPKKIKCLQLDGTEPELTNDYAPVPKEV